MRKIFFNLFIGILLILIYLICHKNLDNLFNSNDNWKSYDIYGVIDSIYRVKNNKNLKEFRIKSTSGCRLPQKEYVLKIEINH